MRKLPVSLIALSVVLLFLCCPVSATEGDLLREIPIESDGGLGLAFDGSTLWYTLWPGIGTTIFNRDTSGAFIRSIDIGVSVGALAWDTLRGHLWAASFDGSGKIYEVDTSGAGSIVHTLDTISYTDADAEPLGGYTDGLAYDRRTDSLWFSPDQSSHVYQISATDGSLMSEFTLPVGQDKIQSGIAYDGFYLWLGFRHDIYLPDLPKIRKYSTSGLMLWGPIPVTERSQDLAWDPVTFAPKCVIWEIGHRTPDPVIRAWEVGCPQPPVGGVWVPINKFALAHSNTELLTPWIGLASLITVATVSIVYVKHRKKQQN